MINVRGQKPKQASGQGDVAAVRQRATHRHVHVFLVNKRVVQHLAPDRLGLAICGIGDRWLSHQLSLPAAQVLAASGDMAHPCTRWS